ncbi:hypothetical protein [Lutibacter sp.]|uniref:hypothetical protein n=1 Tax=Lutibacter sp. TaxID=1925666 RepID=UPI00349FF75C
MIFIAEANLNIVGYTPVINTFLSVDNETLEVGSVYTGEANTALDELTRANEGSDAGAGFFDVFKLLVSAVSLLTPLPILAVIVSLQMTAIVKLMIAAPLAIMYFLAIIEFVGNRQL